MPRYIDADKADVEQISCYYGENCHIEDVQEWLDEQPIADVVEVVRCKDCAFWTYEGVGSSTLKRFGSCAKWYPFGNERHNCHDDDFCSYGERRNDG